MTRSTKLIDPTDAPGTGEANVYVLGGGSTGVAVARRLRAEDRSVALIDAASASATGVPTRRADPTDPAALADAGVEDAPTVVVATPSDSRNLLVAQLAVARFDVDRVVVRANCPTRRRALADAGHDTVCGTTAVADAMVDRV
ncbi:MAG: NAD-binding protein [Haloferacaceae archaeon]